VFYPPLPVYVYAVGALILLCTALRVALVSFVTRENTRDQEDSARESEQNRLLRELHETTKQDVHGISLALGSTMEAERRGDRQAVQKTLGRAFGLAREAEYRISRPYDDLRDSQREVPISPDDYLRGRLTKFEEYFNTKTHEDLQAPLDVLTQEEVATVNRVVVEAFWNVAKHSKARNLYLESRRVGRVLLVRVRDDGRGFDPEKSSSGMGLQYIRLRAAEVGASLDVISSPGRGTTVQLRFEKK
jgi:signal transduction histidine kinase